jgi:hypothetical protein
MVDLHLLLNLLHMEEVAMVVISHPKTSPMVVVLILLPNNNMEVVMNRTVATVVLNTNRVPHLLFLKRSPVCPPA